MADLSTRLREPLVLTMLIVAVAGWLAFLAMWVNSAGQGEQLRADVAALTAARDAAQQNLAEREETAGSLDNARAELENLQAALADATGQLDAVNQDLESGNSEIETARQSLAATQEEVAALDARAEETTASVQELAARQAALQSEIQASNRQLNDVGARLEDARRQEETATANVAQLAEEAAEATASLAETQSRLQTAREDLTAAQDERAMLAQQTEAAGADLLAAQQQVDDLAARRETLNGEVQGYAEQLRILQPQVEALTQTLAERSRALEDVESGIASERSDGAAEAPTDVAAARAFAVTAEGEANGLRLVLYRDGTFEMQDRTGSRVEGSYTLGDGELVLSNVSGHAGAASFPMTCPVEDSATGLSVGEADGCMLGGVRFEVSE